MARTGIQNDPQRHRLFAIKHRQCVGIGFGVLNSNGVSVAFSLVVRVFFQAS